MSARVCTWRGDAKKTCMDGVGVKAFFVGGFRLLNTTGPGLCMYGMVRYGMCVM
jgi:hypothetical protein